MLMDNFRPGTGANVSPEDASIVSETKTVNGRVVLLNNVLSKRKNRIRIKTPRTISQAGLRFMRTARFKYKTFEFVISEMNSEFLETGDPLTD